MITTWRALSKGIPGAKEVPSKAIFEASRKMQQVAPRFEGDWAVVHSKALNADVIRGQRPSSRFTLRIAGDAFGLDVTRNEYGGVLLIQSADGREVRGDIAGIWHDDTPTLLVVEGLGVGDHLLTVTIDPAATGRRGSECVLRSLYLPPESVHQALIVAQDQRDAFGLSPLPDIVSINARQDANVGDEMSVPARYFPFLSRSTRYDMFDWHPRWKPSLASRLPLYQALETSNLIIGGGGLLQTNWFAPALSFLRYSAKRNVVLWGPGHNSPDPATWHAGYDDYDFSASTYARIGVRDYGTRFPWVPCASCMMPELLEDSPIRRPLGFFLHAVVRETIDEIRRQVPDADILENFADVGTAIQFLKESEMIVTNSFHGVYWATLLKRRVVGIPTSSKFFSLKHAVPLAELDNWREALSRTEIHDDALEECRHSNIAFAKSVYDCCI